MNFPAGEVAWYVIGRFYIDADSNAFDAGYFPYIAALPGPFFQGDSEGENTAYFTFYADKFAGNGIQNGNVAATLFPPGNWSMYLMKSPAGNWQAPASFKGNEQQKIAVWRRTTTTMSTTIGTASVSLLTFKLEQSWPFEWQGQQFDLKDLFPDGVTQMGFGSPELLDGLAAYPSVKAFTASAIVNKG